MPDTPPDYSTWMPVTWTVATVGPHPITVSFPVPPTHHALAMKAGELVMEAVKLGQINAINIVKVIQAAIKLFQDFTAHPDQIWADFLALLAAFMGQ